MHPFLTLPGFNLTIPAYGLMQLIGITLCFAWIQYCAPRRGFNQDIFLPLSLITSIIAILGGHLFYLAVTDTHTFLHNPFLFFDFRHGGFTSFGGFISGTLAITIYAFIKKMPFWDTLDFFTTVAPIQIIFIRIGCILAGCCYGKPTTSWLHFTFSNPDAFATQVYPNIPLIPVQLYDIFNGLFLFFLFNWFYPKRQFSGQLFALFFIIYPITRGLIEFLRGDNAPSDLFFHQLISSAQITCLCLLCLSIPLYLFLQKQAESKSLAMA